MDDRLDAIGVLVANCELEEITLVDKSDYVVDIFLIHGHTGILFGEKQLSYMLQAVVLLHGSYAHTGDKHLGNVLVIKLQSGAHKVAFLLLQNALFLDLVDDIFQLVLGYRRSVAA